MFSKTLFFVIAICIQLSILAQPTTQFQNITLQEALAKSAVEHKPVFFMGYASWCTHCEKMLTEVFTDSTVADYYNKTFICIKQDMEQGDGKLLAKNFGVVSFPTFVFLDASGEVLYQIVGEFKNTDIIEQGKTSFTTEKQLPYLKMQFQNNPGDSTACYQYLLGLNRARLDAMPIINTYFALHRNSFDFNMINWKILNISVSDMESEEFKFMVEHRQDFATAVTQQKVDRKLFRTAAFNLQTASNANDTTTYYRKRLIAQQLNIYQVDSLIFTSDLSLYERNKNWHKYIPTAEVGAQKYVWTDYATLKHIADIVYTNTTDAEAILLAADIAKQSASLKPEYGNTLLYAKLLLKAGNKGAAKEAALSAKNIALKTQSSTAEADAILNQVN